MTYSLEPDALCDRYANHVGKLFDRLDSEAYKIELKEYYNALLAARQLVMGLVALRKGQTDADTGSAVRKYADAFSKAKDAARGGTADGGSASEVERTTASEPDPVPVPWPGDGAPDQRGGNGGTGQ